MATIKQINANRRNSQLSTGPVTPEGKQCASQNALKSGIHAESEVIFTERREDLEALTAEYRDRFQPTTPEARDLVDSVIRNSWLLRRLATAEAAIYHSYDNLVPPAQDLAFRNHSYRHELEMLQRRISATERNYHRSLKALQALEPPPAALQPEESKPTSEKLASFPQAQQPAAEPSTPCSLLLAPCFPNRDPVPRFLSHTEPTESPLCD